MDRSKKRTYKKKKQYGGNMLFLKTLTGQTIVLDNIERNITIKQLKRKVSENINVDPEYIRLVWAGKILGIKSREWAPDKGAYQVVIDEGQELLRDIGYDLGQDKGIHIIIDYQKMKEDEELLKAKQRLAFMKSMITEIGPVTYLDELQNLSTNINSGINTRPGVREREKYQTDYEDYDYDDDGYDFDGYDLLGYDADGYDPNEYNIDGYDRDGYDPDGYDANGIHVDDEPMNQLDGGYLNIKRGGYLNIKRGGTRNKRKTIKNEYRY